jgi:hypothetical protein
MPEFVPLRKEAQTTNTAGACERIDIRNRLPTSIAVGVNTGGVGSTLLTQTINWTLNKNYVECNLVSVDVLGVNGTSKLKKILPNTDDISLSTLFPEILTNPNAFTQQFDELALRFNRGGVLVDFGANLVSRFVHWAKVVQLATICPDMPSITLVVPVVGQPQSVADATDLIRVVIGSAGCLPIKHIVVVHNLRYGSFDDRIDGYDALEALEKTQNSNMQIDSFELPCLYSEIWGQIQSLGMSFEDIVALSPRELEQRLQLSLMVCGRGKRFVENWLEDAEKKFKAGLGL